MQDDTICLPEVMVFAGLNESEKSTIIRMAQVRGIYINADDIKRTTLCSNLDAAKKAEHMDGIMKKPVIDFTTERLHIRTVSSEDKSEYMSLRVNNSNLKAAYFAIPGFEDFEWENELNAEDDIHLSVFLKNDNTFIGSASIQNFKSDILELGYDVVEEFRNLGYATEIVSGLLSEIHRIFPNTEAIIRTDRENTASKNVAKKCGGVLIRNEDSFASRLFQDIKEKYDHVGDDFESVNGRADMMSLIEQGRESVCVYKLP